MILKIPKLVLVFCNEDESLYRRKSRIIFCLLEQTVHGRYVIIYHDDMYA